MKTKPSQLADMSLRGGRVSVGLLAIAVCMLVGVYDVRAIPMRMKSGLYVLRLFRLGLSDM